MCVSDSLWGGIDERKTAMAPGSAFQLLLAFSSSAFPVWADLWAVLLHAEDTGLHLTLPTT